MYSLDKLSEINFELTSYCNSKCPQCPRYDMFGNVRKDLDLNHIEIDLIKNLPFNKMTNLTDISFCGNFGDPLMHPELDKIINFFKNKKISISTNASLRSKDWWGDLGKNKDISVTFCIDGIGKEHEFYRRNTSYEKIIDNANSFIQSGGNAEWQFIVFKHNEHQIEMAKNLSNEMGFKNIKFMYSDRFDKDNVWKVYENNQYLYNLEKSTKQITLRESLNSPAGEKYWGNLNKNKGEISCYWSKNKRLYIHSNGTVYPCCLLGSVNAGKNIEKLLLRKLIKEDANIDLHHKNLEDILTSEIFTKYLPESFKGKPFSHPICIEWCNKTTGKYSKQELNVVNT